MIDFVFKTFLSDHQLTQFWDVAKRAKRDVSFFYDRERVNDYGFIQWVRSKDNAVWLVRYDRKIVAMCALNSHKGKTAYGHFLFLPDRRLRIEGKPFQTAICSETLKYWLSIKGVDGEYILDRVLGLTPVTNKPAVHLVHSWGAKEIATIPGACFLYDKAENVDGLVTETTLENL